MALRKLFSMLIIASIIASCSMVKSPQSANFYRVKYNSHLSLAKKDVKGKLPETISSFEEEISVISDEPSNLERMKTKPYKTNLLASTKTLDRKTSGTISFKIEDLKLNTPKKADPSIGLFGQTTNSMHPRSIDVYLNKPLPSAAVEEVDLENLLYIILVVLLVLIIIGLIADLAGGLIGTLLAVLIILLILRLLDII